MALKPNMQKVGFEQLTVSTTALGLTATKYAPNGQQDLNVATFAVADVETNPIRYRDDGVPPTSSVGQPASAGAQIQLVGVQAIRDFLAIRSGAADSTLEVSYYREGP